MTPICWTYKSGLSFLGPFQLNTTKVPSGDNEGDRTTPGSAVRGIARGGVASGEFHLDWTDWTT